MQESPENRKVSTLSAVFGARSLDTNNLEFKKRALRSAILFIASMKVAILPSYVILYVMVRYHTSGVTSMVIQMMTIAMLAPQIIHVALLFCGAKDENIFILEMSLWLSLIIASYHTVLGMMGGIYFISLRLGFLELTVAVIYIVMASSFFTVICHDILVIYSYKELLYREQTSRIDTERTGSPKPS